MFAGSLYFAELDFIRRETKTDLRKDGIVKVCEFLSTVALINEAAKNRDLERFWNLATKSGANLEDLNEAMKVKYVGALHTAVTTKQKLSMSNLQRAEGEVSCKLLNHADIQDCIDMVNSEGNNVQPSLLFFNLKKLNPLIYNWFDFIS